MYHRHLLTYCNKFTVRYYARRKVYKDVLEIFGTSFKISKNSQKCAGCIFTAKSVFESCNNMEAWISNFTNCLSRTDLTMWDFLLTSLADIVISGICDCMWLYSQLDREILKRWNPRLAGSCVWRPCVHLSAVCSRRGSGGKERWGVHVTIRYDTKEEINVD